MAQKVYRNSTEVANVGGESLYLNDVVDACLVGRLNLFLQGDTGSGKTQLAADAMSRFGDKSMFILGRNDLDTKEMFQQINLEKLRTAASSEEVRELTDKIGSHLYVVDELPNCVSAVRAQLFNLFDGFVELRGNKYPIGNGYSVGIATGNIGQRFTESSNDLGRALRDRMHVTLDVDHFHPTAHDTLRILDADTNPRVAFDGKPQDESESIIKAYNALKDAPVPAEKIISALYLVNGLDHCTTKTGEGSKRKMKEAWPTELPDREQASIDGLVLPLSMRAAKSVIRLSQALDYVAAQKGAKEIDSMGSMFQAYRLVAPYSGVLYSPMVQGNQDGDNYKAIDSVIANTQEEFNRNADVLRAGLEMVGKRKLEDKVLSKFTGRWKFMRDALTGLVEDAKAGGK